MAFLPMAERELRVAARRPSTYWVRSAAAFCVLFIWFWITEGSRNIGQARISQNIFMAFGVLALAFCLTVGIFLTSDCLSEEKREGTLGLLFLTDLRGYDVVLGKLIGTSVRSVSNLIAILPVFALPLLMGGVTRGEFLRVILALLAALFLSLSLGMFVSALNREARQAMSGTFLGLLVLGGVLPVMWWVGIVLHFRWPAAISLSPSPVYLFHSAFDIYYRTRVGPGEFWTSLLTVISLSILFDCCGNGSAARMAGGKIIVA
jgi:ABC-type transport system involved in cytochrome c biogenesis permease component